MGQAHVWREMNNLAAHDHYQHGISVAHLDFVVHLHAARSVSSRQNSERSVQSHCSRLHYSSRRTRRRHKQAALDTKPPGAPKRAAVDSDTAKSTQPTARSFRERRARWRVVARVSQQVMAAHSVRPIHLKYADAVGTEK